MKNNRPLCIAFAGVIGSSKTPIANYLSGKFNLPVFNNDAIRSEVIEDFGFLDEKIHRERRDFRIKEIIEKKMSFICDASIDREWEMLKSRLQKYDYDVFIISLDLNKEFLTKLYRDKGYDESLIQLDKFMADHTLFVNRYADEISLSINDVKFKDRLLLASEALAKFLVI